MIGVAPDGKINGQQIRESTLRDVATMLGRFEPAARVEMDRVDVGAGRTVIVLDALSAREHAPFIFEGKPYRRVGSTTTVMGRTSTAGSCSTGTTAAVGVGSGLVGSTCTGG